MDLAQNRPRSGIAVSQLLGVPWVSAFIFGGQRGESQCECCEIQNVLRAEMVCLSGKRDGDVFRCSTQLTIT